MPVEIRELTIKATVGHSVPTEQREATTSSGNNVSPNEKKAIIEECVEQVLSILEKKKER